MHDHQVLIIGCGRIGERHLRRFLQSGRALVTACDAASPASSTSTRSLSSLSRRKFHAGLLRERGKQFQGHFCVEDCRPAPAFAPSNGISANIEFQWRRWLQEGWLDFLYLQTSWYEATEDLIDPEVGTRSNLARNSGDHGIVAMLTEAVQQRVPVFSNRYIGQAVGTDEYIDDFHAVMNDRRLQGFDVYEFAALGAGHQSRKQADSGLGPLGKRSRAPRSKE